MSLLLFLCVLLCLIQSINGENLYQTINEGSPTITGISGCSLASSTRTVNCPRPVTLTLSGTGFLTGLESQNFPSFSMSVSLLVPGAETAYACSVVPTTVSDTSITCSIWDNGFGSMVTNTLLDLLFINTLTQERFTLTQAVSFAVEHAPRVDRVSGCPVISSDGRSASQCDLLNDQITLYGVGFKSVDHSFGIITLGTARQPTYLAFDNILIVRYTDDQLVFNFGSTSTFISGVDAASNVPLPLSMKDGSGAELWSTDPVYVTFINLPDPIIRSFYGVPNAEGCTMDNSTTPVRFRDCEPNLASIWANGDYLFAPVTVTVGGVPARITTGSVHGFAFNIPVFQSAGGVFYDVVVTTPTGSVTFQGMISISQSPLIYDVVPCIDTGSEGWSTTAAHCRPTETLTLKVMNIRQTATPRIVLTNAWNATAASAECPNVRVIDSSTITCVMPNIPVGWVDTTSVGVRLEWPDGSQTGRILVTPLFDPIDAPRITSLSGCFSNSNDPMHLNQCLGQSPNGVLLTIHGVRFGSPSQDPWFVMVGLLECYRPITVSSQSIVCLLPDLNSLESYQLLSYNVKYAVTVQRWDPSYKKSNAAYVTFVQAEAQSSSSSTTSATTIALATVFSIVGAVLIAGCIFMICRTARLKRRNPSDLAPEFSSTGKHVELEEV